MSEPKVLEELKSFFGIDDDSFDLEFKLHVEMAFASVRQMGIIDETPKIDEDTEWVKVSDDIDPLLKMLIIFLVRLSFDPPSSGILFNAFNDQVKELQYRISLAKEEEKWKQQQTGILDMEPTFPPEDQPELPFDTTKQSTVEELD